MQTEPLVQQHDRRVAQCARLLGADKEEEEVHRIGAVLCSVCVNQQLCHVLIFLRLTTSQDMTQTSRLGNGGIRHIMEIRFAARVQEQ